MIETQPGEGRNDIMGLAFLIAFAAFLINGHQRRAPTTGAVQDTPDRDAPLLDKGPLIVAGIAAGLAASVKLTFLIPVAAITIGVVIFSGRGRRLTTAWVLGLSALVVGGYWYLRAAIKTGGNPIPQSKFGPLNLPTPDQMPLDPRPRFAVAHYLDRPDDLPLLVLSAARQRLRPVMAADPDRRRRRRGLPRRPLPQPDPSGGRRRGAGDSGRLRLYATDRGRPGGLADRLLHQHPIPGAGTGAGDDDAADRATAAGAGGARQPHLYFLLVVYAITVLTTPRWYPGFIVGTVFLTLALVWAPAGLGLMRARRTVTGERWRSGSSPSWCWR